MTNKKQFLNNYFGKYGDFEICWLENDKSKSKWTLYSEANEYLLENCNIMTIAEGLVVLDIETKEKEVIDHIKARLKEENYCYDLWDTGGRGYHFYLEFPELETIEANKRKLIKERLMLNICKGATKPDLFKAGNRTMISIPYTPHRKTGKVKTLIEQTEGENKLNPVLLEIDTKLTAIQSLVFDEALISKELHSCLGFLNDLRYFGFFIPKNETEIVTQKNKKFTRAYQRKQLVLVLSNRELLVVDDEFKQQNNVTFTPPPLIIGYRWNLSHMKEYVLGAKVKTLKEVFENIKSKYEQNIFFGNPLWYSIHALWDIGTYFFDIFEAYPYIELTGLMATGKTKVMKLSSFITFNGIIFLKPRASNLFRYTALNRATLYLDEAEKLFKENKRNAENDDVVEYLNSGWQQGAYVPRSEKNITGNFEVQLFPVYCPKQIASIKGVSGALQDRCITNYMVKAPKEDKRGDTEPENDGSFQHIRNNLYSSSLICADKVKQQYKTLKKDINISNRNWQMWKPLCSIAKIIDEGLYLEIGKFAEKLCLVKDAQGIEADTWEAKTINAVISILEVCKGQDVRLEVSGIKENIEVGEKERKPSETWIGKFLNRLGLGECRKRDGKGVYYFVSYEKFVELLRHQNIVTHLTQVTQETEREENLDITEERVV